MTAGGAKRPYNIKFANKVNLFGFGEAKKWVLLADYYDSTLMRNRMALQLGKNLGLDSTMDTQRVEVYVDGEYRGLYLLTEKIEADDNRVNIKTKNGDFLVELDHPSRTEDGNIYLLTDSGKYFRLREPEPETDEEIETAKSKVKSKLNEFENVLASGNWDEISEKIDLTSFVKYGVLNEYFKTHDFPGLSVYFYYHNGKFYGGPTWDHDLSSGLGASVDPKGLYALNAHYYKYLMDISEFQSALFKELLDIKKESFFENLYKEGGFIDTERTEYSAAIEGNNDYWGKSDEAYNNDITALKTWLKNRDEWLQDYFFKGVHIVKEDDNKFYSYVNGERQTEAGFVELDGNYYYAQKGGEIKTDSSFIIDGNNYSADVTGKILFKSITDIALSNTEQSFTAGRSASFKLSLSINGDYGDGVSRAVNSSRCSLSWSVGEFASAGITFENGTFTISPQTAAGSYKIPVSLEAAANFDETINGTAQAVVSITINVVNVPSSAPTIINNEVKSEDTEQNNNSEPQSQEQAQEQKQTQNYSEIQDNTNETPTGGGQFNDVQPYFESISAPIEASTLNTTSEEGVKRIIDALKKISVLKNILEDASIEIVDILNDSSCEVGALAEPSDVDESYVPSSQKIAVTFNRIKITEPKIYVFKGRSELPAGSRLYLILAKSSFLAEASVSGAVFFDEYGEEITATTEDNQVFNVAAYIEAGEYVPVVASDAPATKRNENTSASSGGGCNAINHAGFLIILFLVLKISRK